DTVEEGNFVSRERLLSCARGDVIVPLDDLYFGIDWARSSDYTWCAVGNGQNDVIDWLKVPHLPFSEQVELIKQWVEQKRVGRRRLEDGTIEEFTYRYVDRIVAVRGDSTGATGDAPNEML